MADKLSTNPYRGTRDFLPEEMSLRTQVFTNLYSVIESFGYLRYDGPLLEPIEVYEAKSGQELVSEQIYRLEDRGGRTLALRPEMTPTVARMIAANARRLQLPARWYSHPNCHRYERPQRGRLREHWQINVDVFGTESPEAEVEMFELIHQMMKALGATEENYRLRVSDRVLVEGALSEIAEIGSPRMRGIFQAIDRWEKIPREASLEALSRNGLSDPEVTRVAEIIAMDIDGFLDAVDAETAARSNLARIHREKLLDAPLNFDPLIIRAFEYYTSTVFEVFDVHPENNRSILGGGRYDNLVALFSKDRVPGIGFGMGDVTLFDFLRVNELLPEPEVAADAWVVPQSPELKKEAREVAQVLRARGISAVVPLEDRNLSRELKRADKAGTGFVVIIAQDELDRGNVLLKDLREGKQDEISRDALADRIRS